MDSLPGAPTNSMNTTHSSSAESQSATKDRIRSIHKRSKRDPELEHKRRIVPRLAARAYHLEEGNTWCQDWIQYQKNTHPVFGLCFHHPWHPVRGPQRVIILVGSIAFGLTMTNIVYLGFLGSDVATKPVNFIYNATGHLAEIQEGYTNVQLQQSMVFLWTVGSFLHSSFDMLIWYMTACACLRPGGLCENSNKFCQNSGVYIAVLLVVGFIFAATTVVVIRLNEEDGDGYDYIELIESEESATAADAFAAAATTANATSDVFDDDVVTNSTEKFSFLVGYSVELVFALFVYYFLTSTIYFSGILGCGRIPIFGGRPYELKKEAVSNSRRSSDHESEYPRDRSEV
mmetsp:Transcript_1904/g.4137  ORF Transcript_1904/g.4137 Transcript_1904/m.4137 type:complete len:345 (+) Transcript_1904:219-1253(+)